MSLAVAYNKDFTVLLFKSNITDENTILTVILFLGLDFIDTMYSEVRSSVALIIGSCTSLLSFPRTMTYCFS